MSDPATPNGAMTKGERDSLLQVARLRTRVAKDQAVSYAAKLKADFEKQLDASYPWDSDETWSEMAKLMEKRKEGSTGSSCRSKSRAWHPRMGRAVFALVLARSRAASDQGAQG